MTPAEKAGRFTVCADFRLQAERRAPCGARPITDDAGHVTTIFQPTRPVRGATPARKPPRNAVQFQPTRPVRGATPARLLRDGRRRISTHAPRAGRDRDRRARRLRRGRISTHAPRAGRDIAPNSAAQTGTSFQPTRPVRGATSSRQRYGGQSINFNPRAPCGARRYDAIARELDELFQPTRPVRGATGGGGTGRSIRRYFNPRAPCGARLSICLGNPAALLFQPTRPVRGATPISLDGSISLLISTHAPRAGRDAFAAWKIGSGAIFQPTRPVRGATSPVSFTG